jgi:L-Ala-D/L-Glu epimerase
MQLEARRVSWPLAGTFAISRGAKTQSDVVQVALTDGIYTGHAECTPYPRYGETVDSVLEQLEQAAGALSERTDVRAIQALLPAGAARNALDCAWWDLQAKSQGTSVVALFGLAAPRPVVSAYTLSLDSPEAMGRAAAIHAHVPLMKLKLAGEGDLERVAAVRENAPNAQLIVDANEGWSADQVEPFSTALAALGVVMIEQPLPAADDALLSEVGHPIPLCADESCHTRDGLAQLVGRYEFINIKLDKTGGLTEALALRDAARGHGFRIMVGCMLASSLAMAPAVLVAQGAEIVDLDGPLWLAKDHEPSLVFVGTEISPPAPALWG